MSLQPGVLMDKDTLALVIAAVALAVSGLSWWANARAADAAEASASEARQARGELRTIEIMREAHTIIATVENLNASLNMVRRPDESRALAEAKMRHLEFVEKEALEVRAMEPWTSRTAPSSSRVNSRRSLRSISGLMP